MEVGFFYKDVYHEPRLKYVLDFIEGHPLNSQDVRFKLNQARSINIYYNSSFQKQEGINIPAQKYFFAADKTPCLNLVANSYSYQGQELFSVELTKKKNADFTNQGQISFDLIETIFFHVSRIEEIGVEDIYLNDRAQLSEELMFLVRQGLEKRPVVDQLVYSFLQLITGTMSRRSSEYHLTHDIDFIQKFKSSLSGFRWMARSVFKGGSKMLKKQFAAWSKDHLNDPYNNFDFLLSKSKGISKTIYFLVDGKHKYDNIYDLSHPIFKSAVKLAKERGYKIGIHPSFLSWDSSDIVLAEKKKLEKAIGTVITCSRQHYLHFDPIKTVEALFEAGITEDASVGYTNAIGFKAGTGFEYFLYNFKNEERSGIKETPLVFMDSAAINEAIREEIDLEDLTQSFLMSNLENTQINFNFHNSRFDPANANYEALKRSYNLVRDKF